MSKKKGEQKFPFSSVELDILKPIENAVISRLFVPANYHRESCASVKALSAELGQTQYRVRMLRDRALFKLAKQRYEKTSGKRLFRS